MHHYRHAFDETDPDATQALEDALPIVEELLAEQRKPEPDDPDLHAAWIGQIAEVRSRLQGPADRAGSSIAELIAMVEARIGTARRAPPAHLAARRQRAAPRRGFKALADSILALQRERAALTVEDQQLAARRAKIAGRQNAIARELKSTIGQLGRRGRMFGG